ncbi:MAG: hypothetical protein Q7V53_06260 [Caldisericota bacterium]|nr:hypothetical protein [Caldisericota bacterium]
METYTGLGLTIGITAVGTGGCGHGSSATPLEESAKASTMTDSS